MTDVSLAGKVVALVGSGSDADRAAAIRCAEAGADLALATLTTDQAADFGMHSIANEAWVLGSEQFVRVMDASDPAAVSRFVEETLAQYGSCDALIVMEATPDIVLDRFAARMGTAGVIAIVGDQATRGAVLERLGRAARIPVCFAERPEAVAAAIAGVDPVGGNQSDT